MQGALSVLALVAAAAAVAAAQSDDVFAALLLGDWGGQVRNSPWLQSDSGPQPVLRVLKC